MNKPSLFAMSLFTLLASCFGTSKKEPEPPKEYPRFPESDAPALKFEHVVLDDDFVMKTFFISADKQSVYVLAYKYYSNGNPDDPTRIKRTDLRMFALDTKGKILRRLDMKHVDDEWGSSMGMIDGELLLFTGDFFIAINTATLAIQEKIPVWHDQHFPTKRNIELMTPDEQRDAYEPLFDDATKDDARCRWLEWPSGKYFVWVTGPSGKRAAWSPMTYQDEVIGPLKGRFLRLPVSLNPQVTTDAGGDHFTVVDGAATIREQDILSGGKELDYPNYKYRSIVQYELTVGSKVAHFSTTDQKRQQLRMGFADNKYLTTSDGAVWVRYMSWIYRIE